jgi:hypothetical protein
MPPMKPMPHVHTYVLNGAGERISKCIHSEDHPRLTVRVFLRELAKGLRTLFTGKAASS